MRGVGGPLLCIGDLLSDVGDQDSVGSQRKVLSENAGEFSSVSAHDLPDIFQENLAEVKQALSRADHSWAGLTLRLCSALETANKMIDYSDRPGLATLSEKVDELQQIVDRRESALTAAKANVAKLSIKTHLT